MVLEVFGSIAAPGEQNNSSGLETMIATDKKKRKTLLNTSHYWCFTHSKAK